MGRKKGDGSKFNQETADRILELMRSPMSLRRACLEVGVPPSTVIHWKNDNPDFGAQYAIARMDQAEAYIDEIMDIADDNSLDKEVIEDKDGNIKTIINHDHINRSRLRVDTRKWYASKVLPKLYGDKLQVDQTVQGSLEMFIDSLAGSSLGPPAVRGKKGQ
ncbi:MAG: DNA packaging protein [Deltaproteobacteria bacterium]|nr:DNA packaging protein [Deltaproteobacteria bacterium]